MISTLTSRRQQFVTTVLANAPICRDHYRLTLGLEQFPPTEPGQFVQLSCRDLDTDFTPEHEFDWTPGATPGPCGVELMSPLAMLRRPFSLAGRRDAPSGVALDVIHRVVGVGTDWMAKLKRDDTVHVLGPLGNTFTLPEPGGIAIMVGGGVGIPPMIYLAEAIERAGRQGVAFCGSLSRDLLALTVKPEAPVPTIDATDPLMNIAEFARHGHPIDHHHRRRLLRLPRLRHAGPGTLPGGFRVQGSGFRSRRGVSSFFPEP